MTGETEMPETVREIRRKARKQHKCCECASTIEAGDEYVYISGVWNGEPRSFKQCRNCAYAFAYCNNDVRSELQLEADEGPGLGDLWNWIDEYAETDDDGVVRNWIREELKSEGIECDTWH